MPFTARVAALLERNVSPSWIRKVRRACWALALVAFISGPLIGMTLNPTLGATLWICASIFALLPFWSHRDQ